MAVNSMKVSLSAAPDIAVQHASATKRSAPAEIGMADIPEARPANQGNARGDDIGRTFRTIYDAWFEDVSRWIRAFGGLEADRDDIAQEVFLVVRRRLDSFDGVNPAGWLYRITRRQVRDFRRRAWVKHIFNRRRSDEPDILPHGGASPSAALEQKEQQRILHTLLQKMNEERRCAFVLFEIDGLSGEEIARIQSVPLNTVWTRLHHARKEFFALAARYQRTADAPTKPTATGSERRTKPETTDPAAQRRSEERRKARQ